VRISAVRDVGNGAGRDSQKTSRKNAKFGGVRIHTANQELIDTFSMENIRGGKFGVPFFQYIWNKFPIFILLSCLK
jgi:hypothetical protein